MMKMKRFFGALFVLGLTIHDGTPQSSGIMPAPDASAKSSALEDKLDTAAALPPALVNIEQDEAASRFCHNIETSAEAARFALQMQQLEAMKGEINERIEILQQKRAEYETWLKKRDDFLDRTQTSFVAIMAKMNPSAAAAQLAVSDDMVAASILLKLNARQSGAIMNELPPEKAASLTHILASAQKVSNGVETQKNLPQPSE